MVVALAVVMKAVEVVLEVYVHLILVAQLVVVEVPKTL